MCRKIKEMLFITLMVVTLVFCARISKSYAITSSSSLIYDGIDVSNWQGYINYEEVKKAGIEVVYIKASQGSNIKDAYFDIKGCPYSLQEVGIGLIALNLLISFFSPLTVL